MISWMGFLEVSLNDNEGSFDRRACHIVAGLLDGVGGRGAAREHQFVLATILATLFYVAQQLLPGRGLEPPCPCEH